MRWVLTRNWYGFWPTGSSNVVGGPGDSVVLAAAGTSDTHAQSDLRRAAALLSAVIGDRVELAFAATGDPRVADAVARLRREAHDAWSSRHTCWRRAFFRIAYATAVPTP